MHIGIIQQYLALKLQFVIQYTDVAVRKGAGKSYHKISGYPTLNKDNEVDILGSKKDSSGNVWKKVRIAGKHIGYVFGKYIKQD